MTLQNYITQARKDILEHVNDFILSKKDIHSDLPYYKETLQHFSTFIPQGKLMRGILILLIAEAYGHKRTPQLLSAATAIEFTHSTLLIHDDIMDEDEVRRGNATIYSIYKHEALTHNINNSLLYGQSMAICIGDIGLYLGIEELLKASSDLTLVQKVTTDFIREIQYTGAAQMDDVALGHMQNEPSQEQIKRVYTYKTGRYTFSLPMKIGGLLAHAPEKELQLLDSMGEKLGIMFQLRDDYIGLTGSEQIIGKPAGSDIRQNKKTLIRAMLLEKADSEDKKKALSLFGNTHITKDDIDNVIQLMNKYHVFEEINKFNKETSASSIKALDQLTISAEYKSLLEELILLNTDRSK